MLRCVWYSVWETVRDWSPWHAYDGLLVDMSLGWVHRHLVRDLMIESEEAIGLHHRSWRVIVSLLIPLKMLLKLLQCLFVTWMRGYGGNNAGAHVAVELLLKMRLKILRLVARLGWSMLLRFLHKMLMLVRLGSYVSSVQLNPYWRWSLKLVLVLVLR